MADLVDIKPLLGRTRSQCDAVEALEAALERAKAGKVVGVAIVEIMPDGATFNHWTKCENLNLMLGGLSRITFEINYANKAN